MAETSCVALRAESKPSINHGESDMLLRLQRDVRKPSLAGGLSARSKGRPEVCGTRSSRAPGHLQPKAPGFRVAAQMGVRVLQSS